MCFCVVLLGQIVSGEGCVSAIQLVWMSQGRFTLLIRRLHAMLKHTAKISTLISNMKMIAMFNVDP